MTAISLPKKKEKKKSQTPRNEHTQKAPFSVQRSHEKKGKLLKKAALNSSLHHRLAEID